MISIPPDVKALIFDLDGTLADTMPIHIGAWKVAGQAFDVAITDEMILQRTGMPTVKVVSELNEAFGWNLVPAAVKAEKDKAYQPLKKEIGVHPIKPIFELAQQYKGTLPMAVGTGSTRKNAMDTLTALAIVDWFGAIITASDVENHKPHPQTYLRCAELLGIAPGDCLVFEDGDYGIQAGVAAGMRVIDVRPYLD